MRILITGANGFLGSRLVKLATQRGWTVAAWGSPRTDPTRFPDVLPLDLTDARASAEAFWHVRPMAVIHAAAMARMSDCQRDPLAAAAINVEATKQLVGLCLAGVARLVFVSTDLVFDGTRGHYQEDDSVHPLSEYARSKAKAERAVLLNPGNLAVRTSLLVGTGGVGKPTFFDQQVAALRDGKEIKLFVDEWRSPLAVGAAAEVLLELATMDVGGILHLGGPQRWSRYEMGLHLADVLGADHELIVPTKQTEVPGGETRPRDVSLDCTRWRTLLPHSPWPDFPTAVRQALMGSD